MDSIPTTQTDDGVELGQKLAQQQESFAQKLFEEKTLAAARQQVFNEYIANTAQEFSQWMKDAEEAWERDKTRLPSPSFSMYPDDELVFERAVQLLQPQKTEEPVKPSTLFNYTTNYGSVSYTLQNPTIKTT